MAIILLDGTHCPLCDRVLGETDDIFATWHFLIDPFHPLWRFSDAAMHQSCFLAWDKRQEFVQLFNETIAWMEYGRDGLQRMEEDGEIVTLSRSVPFMPGTQERRRTDIHDAAKTGSVEDIVQLLRDDPAQVNAPDETGVTPLHLAVAYRGVEEVENLLRAGADIHAKTDTGQTALHTACIQGQVEVVRLLLAAGSDVHARDRWIRTPLHGAAATSGPEVVAALLAAGADLEARDSEFQTPLHKAMSPRQEEVISVLLDAGADINAYDADGQTCLHILAQDGNALFLRLLLSRGAGTAAKDVEGCTARQVAASAGRTMAVRLIDHADKSRIQADSIYGC